MHISFIAWIGRGSMHESFHIFPCFIYWISPPISLVLCIKSLHKFPLLYWSNPSTNFLCFIYWILPRISPDLFIQSFTNFPCFIHCIPSQISLVLFIESLHKFPLLYLLIPPQIYLAICIESLTNFLCSIYTHEYLIQDRTCRLHFRFLS